MTTYFVKAPDVQTVIAVVSGVDEVAIDSFSLSLHDEYGQTLYMVKNEFWGAIEAYDDEDEEEDQDPDLDDEDDEEEDEGEEGLTAAISAEPFWGVDRTRDEQQWLDAIRAIQSAEAETNGSVPSSTEGEGSPTPELPAPSVAPSQEESLS